MKIIVVVCIYDRFENLRRWIHAWNLCDKMEASLYIVNNTFKGIDTNFWKDYCEVRGINYIQRGNTGYETGVIQDVITGKIIKEEWDVLFFMTDDTIPIKTTFIEEYVGLLSQGAGLVCMEISGVVTPHVRTTGWCIRKSTAKRLTFPSKVIKTKSECYHFEHTGGSDTLMAQIIKMDKRVVQASDIQESSLWDTHNTTVNRWEEWHREFPQFN